MIYIEIFCRFFLVGLFSIGGGLATLPFLYDISDTTGWFTHTQLADMLAIAESSPGAIGINTAACAGYHIASVGGAVCSVLGEVAPGIIIILIIAALLDKFRNNRYVEWALWGLRAASAALITAAWLSIVKISLIHYDMIGSAGIELFDVVSIRGFVIAAIVAIIMKVRKDVHPIVLIIAGAIMGIVSGYAF